MKVTHGEWISDRAALVKESKGGVQEHLLTYLVLTKPLQSS